MGGGFKETFIARGKCDMGKRSTVVVVLIVRFFISTVPKEEEVCILS